MNIKFWLNELAPDYMEFDVKGDKIQCKSQNILSYSTIDRTVNKIFYSYNHHVGLNNGKPILNPMCIAVQGNLYSGVYHATYKFETQNEI